MLQDIWDDLTQISDGSYEYTGDITKKYYLKESGQINRVWGANVIPSVLTNGVFIFSDVPVGTYTLYQQRLSSPMPFDTRIQTVVIE